MILDLLPWKISIDSRRNLGFLRYIVFAIFFLFPINHIASVVCWSFILGNLLYYFIGIVSAWKMKDNRAFGKYFCPVAVF